MKNNRGWLRIVEAFVAILLITMVALIIINEKYIKEREVSKKIYGVEVEILSEIISSCGYDIESYGDGDLPYCASSKVERIPDYLDCEIKICGLYGECELSTTPNAENIYVQFVPILADENSKQLKIFCWINI